MRLCTPKKWVGHDSSVYDSTQEQQQYAEQREDADIPDDIDYPQVGQENAVVDVETVPTREDLLALIDGECIRDKAMYAVLWESGCRVTALTSLKVRHWTQKGEGYGIVQVPGTHVEGLKGAEHPAKPITFSRGYLDNWLTEHARPDDPDAPLFHGIRPQDDPTEHLHPHSINTQLKRIARRTDGVDAEHIPPHTFKYGRASEMRASEKYSKDDIKQILDWEEGTPMHGRYEHVTEVDEAERILRKHDQTPRRVVTRSSSTRVRAAGRRLTGTPTTAPRVRSGSGPRNPGGGASTARPRPMTIPSGSNLRTTVPSSLAQLPPGYYEHVLDIFSLALVRSTFGELSVDEPEVDVTGVATEPEIGPDDAAWLREEYPEIEALHRDEHPGSHDIRTD
jgi:integrase